MKVWITKYALTKGIIEEEAEICLDHNGVPYKTNMIDTKNYGTFHYEEWHKTKEQAIKMAEDMRKKKIESLKKQITKLEKMKFE